MLDMRVYCYLVRMAQLGQDVLGLATFLGGEEVIRRYVKSVPILSLHTRCWNSHAAEMLSGP